MGKANNFQAERSSQLTSPSSSASSNTQWLNVSFFPDILERPNWVPAALIFNLLRSTEYLSLNKSRMVSKSLGGNPSKRISWCNFESGEVFTRICPLVPKIDHWAPVIVSEGMLRVEEITSSLFLPNKAEFHLIPLSLQAKVPTECPWRPMCFQTLAIVRSVTKTNSLIAALVLALKQHWAHQSRNEARHAATTDRSLTCSNDQLGTQYMVLQVWSFQQFLIVRAGTRVPYVYT